MQSTPSIATTSAETIQADLSATAKPKTENISAPAAKPSASGNSPISPKRPPLRAHFTSTLDALGVSDVLQIFQMSERSGLISISYAGTNSWIWCQTGAVIDAKCGKLGGESALHRIVGMANGQMKARLGPVSRRRTIHGHIQHLLLESARRQDASSVSYQRLGGTAMRYRLTSAPSDALEPSAVKEENSLLNVFRSAPSLREVVDNSELGELESLHLIESWVATGYLVCMGVAASETPKPLLVTLSCAPALLPTLDELRPSLTQSHTTKESLSPLALSVPSTRHNKGLRPSLVWGALVILLLVPVALQWRATRAAEAQLAFTQTALTTSTSEVELLSAEQAPADKPRVPQEQYLVALEIAPAGATVQLDGANVLERPLRRQLKSDGTIHELRISAAGFIPTTLIFRDAPPPERVELQAWTPRPAAATPTKPRLLSRSYRAPKHKLANRPNRKSRPTPPKQETQNPEPRIQVIGDDEPLVGVLY